MAKSWRCHLRLHRWVRKQSDDGKRYVACRDCGKDKELPASAGGFLGGGGG
jgi:hypothetical protein